MKLSATLSAALLASGVVAAPTPGLISSILGLFTNDLNQLLNSLGIKIQTNANQHGATVNYHSQCPFTINPVPVVNKTNSHDLSFPKPSGFVNWKTFKANGANLGGWLEKEQTHDPIWWSSVGGDGAPDEWTLCQNLGSKCGPVLEERYASFLNTTTIDQMAAVGVNTLRIPTTYAAWVKVPGSALYHGNQQQYLKTISDYAINKYGMHIIIGLHSLPGGVNNLDIGEALMHDNWFYNSTNLDYSFRAVDGILSFIKNSGHMSSYTIAPINEASDNLSGFGTPQDYPQTPQTGSTHSRIPMMIQDCFQGASYWSPFYRATANIVFDSHVYYFAAAGAYSQFINPAVCGQAAYLAEETEFPVFVGEWSVQTMYNNSFSSRKALFDTQRFAWNQYVAGGAFWTAVSYSTAKVDGEGSQREYWSYVDLIRQGVITLATNASYC